MEFLLLFPLTHPSFSNSFWIVLFPRWSVTITFLVGYLNTSVACTLGTWKAPGLQTSNVTVSCCFWIILLFAVLFASDLSFLFSLLKHVQRLPTLRYFLLCWSGFLWFCSLANYLVFHLCSSSCLHFNILPPHNAFFLCSVKVLSSFRFFLKSYC